MKARILLDTQILLWMLAKPDQIPRDARVLVEDVAFELSFSAASIWEIAIKKSLGRPYFVFDPTEIAEKARRSGIRELMILSEVAALVVNLPHHHRDPFDRLLVVQAMAEQAMLLTTDRALVPYSGLVRLV